MSSLLLASALFVLQATGGETGSAHAGPAGLEVLWAHTWDEAVASAKALPGGNGRILIEFTDEDCGDCSRMESLILPSTSFFSFTRDKVPVQLRRSSEDGARLSRRLGVTAIPAWVVVTPDLVMSGAQAGVTSQSGWIDTFSRSERLWARYMKNLELERTTPGDLGVVFSVAVETFNRGGENLAEPRFRRIASGVGSRADLRDQSLAYLATMELDAKRFDEAARDLDAILAGTTDPKLREKAELRRADVEIGRGRKDLAISRLLEFQKNHPGSLALKEVDELLEALRPPKDPKAAKGGASEKKDVK
jgi:hypothetical protein